MTAWDVISNIPARTPLWVWPLLIWMIWDGVRARRRRRVAIWFFWLMPFFALLSIRGRIETTAPEIDLPVYVGAYAIGLVFGHCFQGQVLVARTRRHAVVKGETLTLITLMTIFWMNFARGVIDAISPDLLHNPAMVAALALVGGACSGQFAGRALKVLCAPVGSCEGKSPI